MGDVQIRWAAVDDAHGIAVVHVDSWRVAYQGLIDQQVLDAQSVDARTERWARWITASLAGEPTDPAASLPHRMLVAERDGAIVGWVTFGPGREEGTSHLGEIAGFYVHPDSWSHGIGHALMTRVELELRAAGHVEAYLWVLRGNERAIRFYERQGWMPDGGEKLGSAGGVGGLEELRHARQLLPPFEYFD